MEHVEEELVVVEAMPIELEPEVEEETQQVPEQIPTVSDDGEWFSNLFEEHTFMHCAILIQ